MLHFSIFSVYREFDPSVEARVKPDFYAGLAVLTLEAMTEFKKGDHVQWNTPQGETTGVVEKKLTEPTEIKGSSIAASEADPRYLVKSDKTGKEAAHKPEALKKLKDQG